jgi:hypothetical protein
MEPCASGSTSFSRKRPLVEAMYCWTFMTRSVAESLHDAAAAVYAVDDASVA